jgi:hypothetical protein
MTHQPETPLTAPEQAGSLERDHYYAIGKVASEWAILEAIIDSVSIRLAGIGAMPGLCFTAQIAGPARKIDALISLAKHRGATADIIKKLNEFSENLRKASEQRNRYVHDFWLLDTPSDPIRFEASARTTVKLSEIPTPTRVLLEFHVKIIRMCNQLTDLENSINEQRSSQKK